MARKAAIAILMCAVMVLVAAAPLALGGSHYVPKGDQGPRANAVTWEYVPASHGVWTGLVVNNGLRSLAVDVYDNTTGALEEVMHQRIRFSAYDTYPIGTVETAGVVMAFNHRYSITVTPNGPKGSSCTVDDVFIGNPPIAIPLIVSRNYLTVVVDGSQSESDGTIVSYSWDFGDGSSAIGVTATHTYAADGTYMITLTVTDNAGLTSSASQTVFVHSPSLWASFKYTVDGLTVNVDASSSYSAVGIASYTWDWGDGTTGTGLTASHTYSLNGSMPAASGLATSGRSRPMPHAVFGFTYATDGVTPLPGCNVTVTNTRTGEALIWNETIEGWDPNLNVYSVELTMLPHGFMIGDILNVTATKGALIGWTLAPITDSPVGYDQIDVILSQMEGFKTVTITLTVTDTFGSTDSLSKAVKFFEPPVASFSYAVDGLTVSVDASSSSSANEIISYAWDWGDGTTGTGVIATHKYAPTLLDAGTTPSRQRARPPPPVQIFGYTFASDGSTPLTNCTVTIENLRTGGSSLTYSDSVYGVYGEQLTAMEGGWLEGDVINVTAVKGSLRGSSELVTTFEAGQWNFVLNITLTEAEPIVRIITLTVTDSIGQIRSISKSVVLQPPSAPLASFNISPSTGDFTTMFILDASGSTDVETPSADLLVRWCWTEPALIYTPWSSEKQYSHQFDYGKRFVRLEVMDSDGLIGIATTWLTVPIPAYPAVKGPADNTGQPSSALYYLDSDLYIVQAKHTMDIDAWSTTGGGSLPVFTAILIVEYYVDDSYNGTNPIMWAKQGGPWASTDIVPSMSSSSLTTATFDLYAAGVTTVADLCGINLQFMNNGALGTGSVRLDMIRIVLSTWY